MSADSTLCDASILLVDDDPSSIHVLGKALGEYKDVRFALNGPDALRLARERMPDIILLDSNMPEEDGFELCAKLKGDARLRPIPVIFVTAHHDIEIETRALELGAADFIAKPINAMRVQLRVRLHLQLKRQLERLEQLANTDSLTGLANRRAVDAAIERECQFARRVGIPVSLLLIDVDCFKAFNDTYGHPAGDECLRRIGRAVGSVARRPTDVAGRFGGEEFAILLSGTPCEGALRVARNLQEAIAACALPHSSSPVASIVTVSIGVASLTPRPNTSASAAPPKSSKRPAANAAELIAAADLALYAAKHNGRNRVELSLSSCEPCSSQAC